MTHQPTIHQILENLEREHEIKAQTNALARKLIQQLQIPYSGELYFHLGQNNACDNHTAIKRWVKHTFAEINSGDFDSTYQALEHQLRNISQEPV